MLEKIRSTLPWFSPRRDEPSLIKTIVLDGDKADLHLKAQELKEAKYELELSRRYVESLALFGGSIADLFLRREQNELIVSANIPLLYLSIVPIFPETQEGEDQLISCYCAATHADESEVRISLTRTKTTSSLKYEETMKLMRERVKSWKVVLPMVSHPNTPETQTTLDHVITVEDGLAIKEQTDVQTKLGGMAHVLEFATNLQAGYSFTMETDAEISNAVTTWPYFDRPTPWARTNAVPVMVQFYKDYHNQDYHSPQNKVTHLLNDLGFLVDRLVEKYKSFQQIQHAGKKFISFHLPSIVPRKRESFEYAVERLDMEAASKVFADYVSALNKALPNFIPESVSTLQQLLKVLTDNADDRVAFENGSSQHMPFSGSRSKVLMDISVHSGLLPIVDAKGKVLPLKKVKKLLESVVEGHTPIHAVPNIDEVEFFT